MYIYAGMQVSLMRRLEKYQPSNGAKNKDVSIALFFF